MISEKNNEQEWDLILYPGKSGLISEIKELWQYRELILLLVKKEFKIMYAQTILGPVWLLLTPLMSSAVLSLVFGMAAGISTDGIPQFLFYYLGSILWQDFSGCVTGISRVFISNAGLAEKVYFPRLCMPISIVLSRQVRFGIQFILFIILYFSGFQDHGGVQRIPFILLTLCLLLEMMALSLGTGIFFAAFTVKYRDIMVLINFAMQMWMYITPVIYPASVIPDFWRQFYMLNPMAVILEAFRSGWLGTGIIQVQYFAVSMVLTIAILCIGILIFQKRQRRFTDTV